MLDKGAPLLAAALGAVMLMLAACSDTDKGRDRGPPEVGYVVVQSAAVPITTELGGRTQAFETSEVRPQVSGIIRRRLFTEGGFVKAGQPLYQIDASLYQAAAEQAAANLASARAAAAAAEERARRLEPLAKMQAVAEQDYTDAVAQARVARAAVAQNAAALKTAQINLRYATISAPISGRIGRSLATPGALVSASQAQPLAVIQQIDPIYVDMQQSSAELTRLRQSLGKGGITAGDMTVRLQLDDGSDYGFTGRLQFSEAAVNEATGTVTLRARFPNPKGLLLPGMFVTALFDQAIEQGAILVPQPAVQRDFNGSAFVYVVSKDNKAMRRTISTARTAGAYWVVTEGLKAGERVITQGLGNLRHDAPVRPVSASKAQRTAPDSEAGEGGTGSGGNAGAKSG
ncbi:efflux RND transporter periplasmic adaptor subunit [Sphingopyxis sp. MWB1]|uniref:efflux RND transporter periplasmic adaptor subunit n=1 Tax=Sphingopyxis sp. MWB1 TaxID=1537715 RepID=UPI00068FBBB0|nr:efflux RND transporter periplasmic adaptor subunit [Sphingopyxis sp. MWB1]